jgi:hypothetical protein
MLDMLVERLEQHLSRAGEVTDVLLKTERSVFADEGTHEVELYFAEKAEEWSKPLATVHLYPLDADTCEVEVEVQYVQEGGRYETPAVLWQQARQVVEEISLTEKRRYISPERLVETAFVLDYHVILVLPQAEAEADRLNRQLEQLAQQLGALVRL